MAAEVGMSGEVLYGDGTIANVVRWAANITRDAHDCTVMVPTSDPDYGWRRRLHGHASASGSVECLRDPRGAVSADEMEISLDTNPIEISLSYAEDDVNLYTGSILTVGINRVSEVDGVCRVSFDFVSEGVFEG